jgi:hypothetical protein
MSDDNENRLPAIRPQIKAPDVWVYRAPETPRQTLSLMKDTLTKSVANYVAPEPLPVAEYIPPPTRRHAHVIDTRDLVNGGISNPALRAKLEEAIVDQVIEREKLETKFKGRMDKEEVRRAKIETTHAKITSAGRFSLGGFVRHHLDPFLQLKK